jgi:hypothetical protein
MKKLKSTLEKKYNVNPLIVRLFFAVNDIYYQVLLAVIGFLYLIGITIWAGFYQIGLSPNYLYTLLLFWPLIVYGIIYLGLQYYFYFGKQIVLKRDNGEWNIFSSKDYPNFIVNHIVVPIVVLVVSLI